MYMCRAAQQAAEAAAAEESGRLRRLAAQQAALKEAFLEAVEAEKEKVLAARQRPHQGPPQPSSKAAQVPSSDTFAVAVTGQVFIVQGAQYCKQWKLSKSSCWLPGSTPIRAYINPQANLPRYPAPTPDWQDVHMDGSEAAAAAAAKDQEQL